MTAVRQPTTSARRAPFPRAPARGLQPAPGLPRRVLNVAVAAVGLVLAAPLMAAIACAIKLTSRGPVFYSQLRIGLDQRAPGRPTGNTRRLADCGGRPFRIYKFRTMAPGCRGPDEPGEIWAQPQDARVTRVGRILRTYRLDELPQLVNVLRGDMNVVGPRPEQPAIFARLRAEIAAYPQRQRVRPGITGWAQVNQSYDSCVEDVRRKLAFDLEYIRRESVGEDLRIMLRTVPVMVLRLGAW